MVKSDDHFLRFRFRESRFANVWYAFYTHVLHAPEFNDLQRKREGLTFLLCLYSVLASCPIHGQKIHVQEHHEYLSFHPMSSIHRFMSIPSQLGPQEFPFEGIPGMKVLQAPPFVQLLILDDPDLIDVTRRPVPVLEGDHDRTVDQAIEDFNDEQDTVRAAASAMAPRVLTADVRYLRSNFFQFDTAAQRLRREEQMAFLADRQAQVHFLNMMGYPRPDPMWRPPVHDEPAQEMEVHAETDDEEDDAPAPTEVQRRQPRPPANRRHRTRHRRHRPQTTPPYATPRQRPCRANLLANHKLNRRGHRIADFTIEGRTRALRSHRELMGPVKYNVPVLHLDDGLVHDLTLEN